MPKKVKPIPTGYHSVTPNFVVNDGSKAIAFYKKAFGAKEIMRMLGPGGAIMHAELQIGDSRVMLNDEMPEMGSKSPSSYGGSPVTFYVYFKNVNAAWKRAVAAGGKPTFPLSDMFWGDRTGGVEDPFGHRWTLAQHVKDLTPKEIKKAQAEFFAQMSGNK